MPSKTSHIYLLTLIAILLTASKWDAYAVDFNGLPKSIIKELTSNYNNGDLYKLALDNENCYVSPNKYPADPKVFLEITIKGDGLTRNDTEDLVVYTKRHDTKTEATYHPTVFEVSGQFDDSNEWLKLFDVHLLFRGEGTHEYSTRIPIAHIWQMGKDKEKISTKSSLKKLRLTAVETSLHSANGNGYCRIMMNRFDVLKLSRTDNYSEDFRDGLHLNSDYNHDLKGYEFVNTQGIKDSHNAVSGWELPTDDQIQTLTNNGIEFPDFSFITSADNTKRPYSLDAKQERQRTHEVEHILYAMPGDVIPLIPYYLLPDKTYTESRYKINFSHWYDYKTGGNVEYTLPWTGEKHQLLDFLSDPSEIQVTDNYGYFGGPYMNAVPDYKYDIDGDNDKRAADEYVAAVKEINDKGYQNVEINILRDLDFSDYDNSTEEKKVPMLVDFKGYINGNRHTINNLEIIDEDRAGVGLLSNILEGKVENIIIDSSCKFTGMKDVGAIAGTCGYGRVSIRNIHTEAKVIGVGGKEKKEDGTIVKQHIGEETAGGLIGQCAGSANPRYLKIENCYIGGTIGDASRNDRNNAAVIAGLNVDETNHATFRNIVVKCNLHGFNSDTKRRFVRYHGYDAPQYTYDEKDILKCWNFTFKDCYNRIKTLQDKAWLFSNPEYAYISYDDLIASGWTDSKTPPMETTSNVSGNYTKSYSIDTPEKYVEVVEEINSIYYSNSNVYIEITADLDFSYYDCTSDAKKVPMIFETSGYWDLSTVHLNGKGHTVKNLYIKKEQDRVGVIYKCGNNTTIENIFFDSSCRIEGHQQLGIIGDYRKGKLTIRNVKTEINIKAIGGSKQNAAALVGCFQNEGQNDFFHFENVYVGGSITQDWHGCGALVAEAPWFNTDNIETVTSTFKNVIVDIQQNAPSTLDTGRKYIHINTSKTIKYSVTNCCIVNGEEGEIFPIENWKLPSDPFDNWGDGMVPPNTAEEGVNSMRYNMGDYTVGTVATFYMPRNPFGQDNIGQDDYIIAADFSQSFLPEKNIENKDPDHKKIYEPIIATRQIFRIRDGRQFAERLANDNDNYIREVRKFVSARANAPFQIALDSPVTNDAGHSCQSRANYYYKVDDNKYDRVYGFHIVVVDGDSKQEITDHGFKFGQPMTSQGVRTIADTKYVVGDGDDKMNRMLMWDNPTEGHYEVHIYGKDDAGNIIKAFGTNHALELMRYDIRFLPSELASMAALEEVVKGGKLLHTHEKSLLQKYGKPKQEITFDEYAKIKTIGNDNLRGKMIFSTESVENIDNAYYKWPLPWDKSDYTFGYDDRRDYNMYLIASHSSAVPWKAASMDYDKNAPNHGKGLYDITYYKTLNGLDPYPKDKIEQGYYYLVNASADPGVTARLRIDDLCQGSTVVVSAWVSEFSRAPETANLSFNFTAVMPDGRRIVLHRFITGYVPSGGNGGIAQTASGTDDKSTDRRGQWLNVYYSFVPRLAEFSEQGISVSEVEHFELELDNNNKDSNGADYAIDEIKCYVAPPTLDTKQLAPVCTDEKMRIRFQAPFETLIEMAKKSETTGNGAGTPLQLYYTILDKAKFEEKYKLTDKTGNYYEAFTEESIVRFNYPGGSEAEDAYFGKIEFSSKYKENPDYDGDGEKTPGIAYYKTESTGERMLTFVVELPDGKITPDKDYYVAFKAPIYESTGSDLVSDIPGSDASALQVAKFFDLTDRCANAAETRIIPSEVFKTDGAKIEVKEGGLNVKVCAGQSPVIQASVYAFWEGEMREMGSGEPFDWFLGSLADYLTCTDGNTDHTLKKALEVFRSKYPGKSDLNDVEATPSSTIGEERLEQWMIDLLTHETSKDANGICRLSLHRSSYPLPALTKAMNERRLVAIPITKYFDLPDDKDATKTRTYVACSYPTELTFSTEGSSPTLRHGLKGIPYPDYIEDVPLRVGLDQLRTEKDADDPSQMNILEIPVRQAASDNSSANSLKRLQYITEDGQPEKEGCVILVETDDPEYRDLKSLDGEENMLPWVGEVKSLTANIKDDTDHNAFQVQFRNNFNFKEGYYYRFRFEFEEDTAPITAGGPMACSGQDIFTLKIVPKYVKWIGNANCNWNNDDNWARMSKEELYLYGTRQATLAPYITDGIRTGNTPLNTNPTAYAPLEFTKAVINDDSDAPYLYKSATTKKTDLYGTEHDWPANPSLWEIDYKPGDTPSLGTKPSTSGIGDPTADIQYDMAAFTTEKTVEGDTVVGCRPWYANRCDEIHFKPGGTLMNHHELEYRKAWVDIELAPDRWHTLSVPLQEAFAGDFYLPKNKIWDESARQETELFQDITFSTDINDRFRPAVFQRGWDKSHAYVVQTNGTLKDVSLKTSWSHVYNHVQEVYGAGTGFSIMTDLSLMKTYSDRPDKVMFRLPKADNLYYYYEYDPEGKQSNTFHYQPITRGENQYKLNRENGTITAETASGKYFLVGNPFITHLDIKKFLEKNNTKVEQKYWMVTEDGQSTGIISTDGVVVEASATGEHKAGVLAPMQGFFVEAKSGQTTEVNGNQQLKLEYEKGMMLHSRGCLLGMATRSEDLSEHGLKITASVDGQPSSAALLITTPGLTGSDVISIDNRQLDVPATVYTVKPRGRDNNAESGENLCEALGINFCCDAECVGIGVIADDNTETTLTFTGTEAISGLKLLDKSDMTLTPIEEGTNVTVKGSIEDRLYLEYNIEGNKTIENIDWKVSEGFLTVYDRATTGTLSVTVSDTLGRIVTSQTTDNNELTLPLSSGIYIILMHNARRSLSVTVNI